MENTLVESLRALSNRGFLDAGSSIAEFVRCNFLALELFLPDGDTVWKTNPRVVADAFGALDVSEESLDRVVLLCFKKDPLKEVFFFDTGATLFL